MMHLVTFLVGVAVGLSPWHWLSRKCDRLINEAKQMTQVNGIIAIFFRDEGFYPVRFSGTKNPIEEAADHAALNPGTRRVEDTDGNILWQETKH